MLFWASKYKIQQKKTKNKKNIKKSVQFDGEIFGEYSAKKNNHM